VQECNAEIRRIKDYVVPVAIYIDHSLVHGGGAQKDESSYP